MDEITKQIERVESLKAQVEEARIKRMAAANINDRFAFLDKEEELEGVLEREKALLADLLLAERGQTLKTLREVYEKTRKVLDIDREATLKIGSQWLNDLVFMEYVYGTLFTLLDDAVVQEAAE